MGARRKARVCALQMLFQFDVTKPRVDELAKMYWDSFGEEFGEVDEEFASRLALGTISHIESIDELIKQRAENWRISRMALVDRNSSSTLFLTQLSAIWK
jgi:N utilization substance protein B